MIRHFHELRPEILIPPQLVGIATEEMSLFLGPTLAGLLNATFGNAIEIIVGIVALFEGEVRIVQTAVCNRPNLFPFNTCLPCVDARFHFIQRSIGFGLLLPRWYDRCLDARSTCTHLTPHRWNLLS